LGTELRPGRRGRNGDRAATGEGRVITTIIARTIIGKISEFFSPD
jgi:hypothetical protein